MGEGFHDAEHNDNRSTGFGSPRPAPSDHQGGTALGGRNLSPASGGAAGGPVASRPSVAHDHGRHREAPQGPESPASDLRRRGGTDHRIWGPRRGGDASSLHRLRPDVVHVV